jgi:hypothetical protein
MQPHPDSWLSTPELCAILGVSRSSLRRWCKGGVLREGQHWVRMNPGCPRSDQLWQPDRCSEQLNRQRPYHLRSGVGAPLMPWSARR